MKITRQFVRYVIVAALATASDWAVFTALLALFGVPIAAQGTSRIIGGLVSFTVNKYWSFQSPDADRVLLEARRFVTLFAISYLVSLSLFSSLTLFGLSPYWAKLVADTVCFFFNFVMMRAWVYRRTVLGASTSYASEPKGRLAGLGS